METLDAPFSSRSPLTPQIQELIKLSADAMEQDEK